MKIKIDYEFLKTILFIFLLIINASNTYITGYYKGYNAGYEKVIAALCEGDQRYCKLKKENTDAPN